MKRSQRKRQRQIAEMEHRGEEHGQREVGPMTRNKDTDSHRRMAAEQEFKVAEKAGEHLVKIGTKIEVEKQNAAEFRKPGADCQEIACGAATQNGQCVEGRDTETTEGKANSYRSLKKPGRLQRRIPKNEKMSWSSRSRRLSRLRRKPSLHTTMKAGQRTARVVREGRNTSRKWKLNSRRTVMTSSLSWTRTSSHQPDGLQEPKDIN